MAQMPTMDREGKSSMKNNQTYADVIKSGEAVLGIEFGSTRIKAVLTDAQGTPLASGSFQWENRLEDGLWTYRLEDIWHGLAACYGDLKRSVEQNYHVTLTKLKALGFSAMMHGYMAFDKEGRLLVPFRTWRNTNTGRAAKELTELFHFNIPLRWSVAHLYEAILEQEPHVARLDYMTTLAGYIHWKMTGERVLGIGDASGMFPIDSQTRDYERRLMERFDTLIAPMGFSWKLKDVLPKVLPAGVPAGTLTPEGARLLDADGALEPGCPLCPPEGDAGTGMAATNSVAPGTGNVSAGTSVFAMIVLEKPLSAVYPEIDMVTTPDGAPVAMVHCNNCTSDLNAWVSLFHEFAESLGIDVEPGALYSLLYKKALEGDCDCGGMMAINYYSGEPVTGIEKGRPLFMRCPDSRFTLANFMRTHLYASLGALKTGLDLLFREESVSVHKIYGHGGLFKTPVVGQKFLAAAINAPVTVMETAGEGGAWGMALLAGYMVQRQADERLGDYLEHRIFKGQPGTTIEPDSEAVESFDRFIQSYKLALPAELAAGSWKG